MFSMETSYNCNSVKLAVAVDPSTLLRILHEAGYRGNWTKNISCHF